MDNKKIGIGLIIAGGVFTVLGLLKKEEIVDVVDPVVDAVQESINSVVEILEEEA